MSLLDLRKNRGDLWDAPTWNRHLEEIDRYLQTLGVSTTGAVRRNTSTGTVYLPLSVDADETPGSWLLSVGFGLLGGMEPKIDGLRVSETDPTTGDPPTLSVGSDDFSESADATTGWPAGMCFVYGVVEFDPSWYATGAKIVAQATPWTFTAWKSARLIGLLQRDDPDDESSDVTVRQVTFFNQALTLSQKAANGFARYWWRAVA